MVKLALFFVSRKGVEMKNNYSKFIILSATIILGGLLFLNYAFAAEEYTITDLGTLGGEWSLALGINDFGQISGGSDISWILF